MDSKYTKYLPIGTIVLLKNSEQKLMIIGYCTTEDNKPEKIYDYNGCIYPVGIVSINKTFLFDHDQIDKIYFLGYKNEDYEKLDYIMLNDTSLNK